MESRDRYHGYSYGMMNRLILIHSCFKLLPGGVSDKPVSILQVGLGSRTSHLTAGTSRAAFGPIE